MSPKWITVLVVGPIAVIVVATLLIIRSVYPPPKSTPIATTTQPVADPPPQQSSAPAESARPSVVDRVTNWLQSGGAKYSISGYSWLNRNNGSSEIQRGLHVQLLPPTVSISAVNETLELSAKSLDQQYEQEKKRIDDERSALKGIGDEYLQDTWRQELQRAKTTYHDPASNMRSNESPQSGVYKTDDAFKFIKEVSEGKQTPFIHVASASKLKEEKTDVQGKFSIDDVPDGQYFLYGCINTPAVFVEWLVPVTVADKYVSITLDNDNASIINDAH